ncbi:ChbG/HpnK family deacetylase [Oryzisolibacter sp. LB2S]|uniref:ChbG/HpnK family deacetylase n=1 Tax=Alicycliphilus soli TaxID=3228789 RepID=UPI0034585E64
MNGAGRGLILCADDYALHPLVDEAVLRLAEAGRLSATSCMTTAPGWRAAAPRLLPLRARLQLGLHFNLTESHGGACEARALGPLLAAAYLRRLAPARVQDAWRAQLDAFEDAIGAPPDYVDGHQHVHQLPGVRAAMLAELRRRYGAQNLPWVRSTAPAGALWRDPKAGVIALLGGWTTTRRLRRAGLAMNQGFGGVYGFDAPSPEAYGAHMRAWLAQMGEGGLIMCHPASAEVEGDAIGRQRPVEFAYLMSDAFAQDLRQLGCRVLQKRLK